MAKTKKTLVIKPLNDNKLDEAFKAVSKDKTYSHEYSLIVDMLKKYPKNDDILITAMKVALIDVTNSTHLHQHKQAINLLEVAQLICDKKLNFDKRVQAGDLDLVNDIANNGKKNIFSFASKYCFYHNSIVYSKDDYAKFDGIVCKCLPKYAEQACVKYKGRRLSTNALLNLKTNYNYNTFVEIIKEIFVNE